MDKKQLSQLVIENLAKDLAQQPEPQRNQISEWLLANQLTKSKKTKDLLNHWQQHSSAVLRRLFWYHQARLQRAMNFCTRQIG